MTLLMFIFALALSGVAAFYSIIGLMAIFAASPIPIAVMGSILEGSKLVVASWLYRNWRDIPRLMKVYFTSALIILMFLTSMGIFGFLSKAHLDQGVPTGDIAAKVALIDEKINTEKENINAARKALNQLDTQIDKFTDLGAVSKGVAVRDQQRRERQQLLKQIETSQTAIAKLNEEKAPVAAELRKVEAEVGPIKYIAALIYGDEATSDTTLLEKAVRWVTILIVVVFDPLAVIMLIAANWSFVRGRKELTPPDPDDDKPTKPEPPDEPEEENPEVNPHAYLDKPFDHFKNLKPMVASMPPAVNSQITDSVTAPHPEPIPEPAPQPEPSVEPPPAPLPVQEVGPKPKRRLTDIRPRRAISPDPVSARVAQREQDDEAFWRSRPHK